MITHFSLYIAKGRVPKLKSAKAWYLTIKGGGVGLGHINIKIN